MDRYQYQDISPSISIKVCASSPLRMIYKYYHHLSIPETLFPCTLLTFSMIMQVDYTSRHAHRRQMRVLAVISTLTQAPPTILYAQDYAMISAQFDDSHFHSKFGYTISEFKAIHYAFLQLPEPVRTREQDVIDSHTGLLMVCAYLCGAQLRTLEGDFGWSHGRTSRIIHRLHEYIYRKWKHLLDVTSHQHQLLEPQKLDYYAATIEWKTQLLGVQ